VTTVKNVWGGGHNVPQSIIPLLPPPLPPNNTWVANNKGSVDKNVVKEKVNR